MTPIGSTDSLFSITTLDEDRSKEQRSYWTGDRAVIIIFNSRPQPGEPVVGKRCNKPSMKASVSKSCTVVGDFQLF